METLEQLLQEITRLSEISISEASNLAYRNTILDYPEKPNKPILKTPHTPQDVREYGKQLEQYEIDMVTYREKKDKYYEVKSVIDNHLVGLMKEQSGLNSIPEQYRDKVYSYAYQQGHSSGYSEIYSYLCELVQIFD